MGLVNSIKEEFLRAAVVRCQTPRGRDFLIAGGIGLVSLALLMVFRPGAILQADMFEYIRQAQYPDLPRNAEHLGFIWLLGAWLKLFPGPSDLSIDLFTSIQAALMAGFTYLCGIRLFGNRKTALFGTAILLLQGMFLFHALFAELYLSKTLFLLAAFYFLLSRQGWITGILLAAAVTITPSALLALPFFILFLPEIKNNLKWMTTFLVCGVLYFSFHPEALFSERMAGAMQTNWSFSRSLLVTFHQLVREFLFVLPWIGIGLWAHWREGKKRMWIVAVAVLFLSNLLFGQLYYDVPVQFFTYMVLIFWGSTAVDQCYCEKIRIGWKWSWLWALPALLVWISWNFQEQELVPGFVFLILGAGGLLLTLGFGLRSRLRLSFLIPFGLVLLLNLSHHAGPLLHWQNFAQNRKADALKLGEAAPKRLVAGLEMAQAYRHYVHEGQDVAGLFEARVFRTEEAYRLSEKLEDWLRSGGQIRLIQAPELRAALEAEGYYLTSAEPGWILTAPNP